ncbi:MAG: hypothetical protein NTV86_00090 [Planctomycetota bacterium]|nr:hypothetical protein [Planctomycetota bacterium]
MIPAVYKTQRLPESVTTIEQAQEHASQTARQWNRLVCLVWSRRLSVYFDEQGQVEVRAVATPDRHVAPFMRIGNKRFLLGDADHATPAKG